MTTIRLPSAALCALSIAALAMPAAVHAVSAAPANPLPMGVVVGALTEQVLCEPTCNAGFVLSLTQVGTANGTVGNRLEAGFGADGTASISLAASPISVEDGPPYLGFYRSGVVSASGSVRAAYQIEYSLPGALAGTTQLIHMNTSDVLSSSGNILVSSHLQVIDSAYGSLTPPVLIPPPPGGGGGGGPPPPPPPSPVYDQSDCLGALILGCFGGGPLTGGDFSILVNEPYDVIMTVSLSMPGQVGATVTGSAGIDPGFAPVNPAPGGTFFLSPSAAPEPSVWLLMVAGVGVVGAAARRRACGAVRGVRLGPPSSTPLRSRR